MTIDEFKSGLKDGFYACDRMPGQIRFPMTDIESGIGRMQNIITAEEKPYHVYEMSNTIFIKIDGENFIIDSAEFKSGTKELAKFSYKSSDYIQYEFRRKES